jgi:hypothetical protein
MLSGRETSQAFWESKIVKGQEEEYVAATSGSNAHAIRLPQHGIEIC